MKNIAFILGSPRDGKNTHSFLSSIEEGARAEGATTKTIKLYDFPSYYGCRSCFVCKRGTHLETCVLKDDLLPVLKELTECDTLVFGSPIFLGDVTSGMRAFMERLIYPHVSYESPYKPKPINTLFVYTMNRSLESAKKSGYKVTFQKNKDFLERVYDTSDYIVVPETAQWDYSLYPCSRFNGDEREDWLKNVFPALRELFKLVGRNLVSNRQHLAESSLKEMSSIMSVNVSGGNGETRQKPILHIATSGICAGGTATLTYEQEKTLLLTTSEGKADCQFKGTAASEP